MARKSNDKQSMQTTRYTIADETRQYEVDAITDIRNIKRQKLRKFNAWYINVKCQGWVSRVIDLK